MLLERGDFLQAERDPTKSPENQSLVDVINEGLLATEYLLDVCLPDS